MIVLALRLTVLLLAASGLSWSLRRRSASLRAALWTAALAASLLLPLMPRPEVAVPRARLPMPLALPRQAPAPTEALLVRDSIAPSVESEMSYDPAALALWVYLAGSLVVATTSAMAFARAARLVRRSHPPSEELAALVRRIAEERGLRRPPQVALAPEGTPPLVAGPFRATILLPESAPAWDGVRLERVLRHEIAHIERGDGLALLLGRAALAAYWCHPLVGWAVRELRQECERAADDVALGGGAKPSDYAEELLAWAGHPTAPSASLPMARRSGLSVRLRHVLDARADRRRASPRLQSAIFLSMVAFAGLLPSVRAEVEKTVVAPLARAVSETSGPVGPTTYRTPEGSTFRLVHLLSMGPDLVLRAWNPQGRPVRVTDPYERRSVKNQVVSAPGKASRWVGAYFEVHDVDPDPTTQPLTDFGALPALPGGLNVALGSRGKIFRDLTIWAVPVGTTRTDAVVTLATGRYRWIWERKVGTGPNDPQRTAPPDLRSVYSGLRYPLRWFRVPFPAEANVWDWSYRATLSDGREIGWNTMQTDPQGRVVVAFEARPSRRVVRVAVGRRPMRRFFAKNLPLVAR